MISSLVKKIIDIKAIKTDQKQIIFLSDDWGSVRIRSRHDQQSLIDKGLTLSNRFDRFDALETNDDLELLFEVLTKYKDVHGNHPVITAVTNVANPDFEKIMRNSFNAYFFEKIDQTYQRYPKSDCVLSLVKQGISHNIFIPQSHGREHLQVNWWLQELQEKDSFARKAFENEFFFLGASLLKAPKRNRGLGAAFDVWDNEDLLKQKEIAKSALTIFEEIYGYRSRVFTPPAMFYSPKLETTMSDEGIQWLDVGRYFKIPLVGGKERYQINYLGRKKSSGLMVLVRNAVFESNLSDTDNGVNRCLKDIEKAFQSKQPAIISNHRACFTGRLDRSNRDKGLHSMEVLLKSILKKWPDVRFIAASEI